LNRSSLTTDGRSLRSSSWTFVRQSLNILHHYLTVSSLITFWQLTAQKSRLISTALIFFCEENG
jgi:hypothetical protein